MIHRTHSAQGKAGKAFAEGLAAAKRGETFCPYRAGTKSRAEWERGFASLNSKP